MARAYGTLVRPGPLVQPSGFKSRCGPWLSARMEGPYSSFPRIGARDCGASRMNEALRFPDLGLFAGRHCRRARIIRTMTAERTCNAAGPGCMVVVLGHRQCCCQGLPATR